MVGPADVTRHGRLLLRGCVQLALWGRKVKVRDRHFWPSDSRLVSPPPPSQDEVPAFITHQCGKAARDATLPMFHAAWLSVRCIPSMGGSVFGNSTSAAVPCPSWAHGLMVEPRARKDFQTLVLGIGIHRLGHRYGPRPGRPLTSHFLSLRVSLVGGRRDSIHRLRDPICGRRAGTEPWSKIC